MPRKDETKKPARVVAQFIKRHLEGGEPVAALAKEFKISRATAYVWLAKHRNQVVADSMKEGVSAASLEKTEKLTLAAEREALKIENRKLRDRILALMIKHGEI